MFSAATSGMDGLLLDSERAIMAGLSEARLQNVTDPAGDARWDVPTRYDRPVHTRRFR